MSFRFRFASILDLRRRQRDEAGGAVGEANEAIRRIDEQVEQIRSDRQKLKIETSGKRTGNLSVDSLLSTGRYDIQLQSDIEQLGHTRVELVKELDRRQAALSTAEAEVKKFERLLDNDKAAQYAAILRHEQAEADDRNSQDYIRAQGRRR